MNTEETVSLSPQEVEEKFLNLVYDMDFPDEQIQTMLEMSLEDKIDFLERDEIADQSVPKPSFHIEKLRTGPTEETMKGLNVLLRTCKISWIKSFIAQEGLKLIIERLTEFHQECIMSMLSPLRLQILRDLVTAIRALANIRAARDEFFNHPEYIGPIISVFYPQEIELMTDLLAVLTVFSTSPSFPRIVIDQINSLRRQRLCGWEVVTDFLINIENLPQNGLYQPFQIEKISKDAITAFFAFIGSVIHNINEFKPYCQLLIDLHRSQVIAHLKLLKEYHDDTRFIIEDARLLKQMFPKELLNPFDVKQVIDFVNESVDEDRKMAINLHLANLIQTSPDNANRAFEYIENFLLIFRQLVATGKGNNLEEAAYFSLHPFDYPELTLPQIFADVFDKYGFLPNNLLQEVPLPEVFANRDENETVASLKVRLQGVQEELAVLRDYVKKSAQESMNSQKDSEEMKKVIEDLKERAIPESDRIKKLKTKIDEQKKELSEMKKFKDQHESKMKEIEKLKKEIKDLRTMRRLSVHEEQQKEENNVPASTSAPVLASPPPPPPPPTACPLPPPPLPTGKRPKNKMRGFFWTKIAENQAKGSVWDDLSDTEIDTDKLEKEFTVKPPAPKSSILVEQKKEASKIVELFDQNRSRSINIMLSRIKLSFVDIAMAISRLTYKDVFTEDQFESLFATRPKPEEIKLVCDYDGDRSMLGDPEKFFLALSRVNDIDVHLQFMNLRHNFSEVMRSISEPLFSIKYALYAIKTSPRLRKVLAAIRTFGNFMNQGTMRGGAAGFKIGTLPTLIDIRGTSSPDVTFLNVLVSSLMKTDESMLAEDLQDIDKAAKIDMELVKQDLNDVKTQMVVFKDAKQRLKQFVADGDLFYPKMEEFEPMADPQIERASQMLEEVEALFKECLDFFCESEKDYTVMSFIEVFSTFASQFEEARVAEMKKLESARQKEIKIAKQAKESRSRQRGILDADLERASGLTKSQEMLIKKKNSKGNRLSMRLASCSVFKLQ